MRIIYTRTIIILALCSVLLYGCNPISNTGPNTPNNLNQDEMVRLTIMHNWVGQDGKAIAMRKILNDFREAHPNLRLVEEGLPTDQFKERLFTVAAANEMPDIFVLFPDSTTKHFVNGDLLMPINSFLNNRPEWRDRFLPGSFDDFTVDGNIYSVPMNLAPSSFIYYNQQLFHEYDVKVPTTWEELLEAIEIFNENGITPIALGNKSTWVVQSTIFSTLLNRVVGTEWMLDLMDPDGTNFTDPEFIRALTMLKDLQLVGAFQSGFDRIDDIQMMQLYFAGESAMFINGGWAASNIVNNAPQNILDHTRITVLPQVKGGSTNIKTTSGLVGTGMGINKKLRGVERDLVFELFYALAGPEGQRATLNSSTLVSYDIEIDEELADPLFVELHELMQSLSLTPVLDGMLNVATWQALNSGLDKLLLGAEPQDIAEQLQKVLQASYNHTY